MGELDASGWPGVSNAAGSGVIGGLIVSSELRGGGVSKTR